MNGIVGRDGLVAEYLFDGNASDSSGRGAHGVVHGAVPTTDRFGNPRGAYLFDGQDDFIVVSPPPALGHEALTVSAWARYDTHLLKGWNNCIVCQDNGDDNDQSRRIFQLSTWNDRVVWHLMVQARDPRARQRVIPGVWYHVAAVVAGGAHSLYVNGILHDVTGHQLAAHLHEPVHIGRKGTPEAYFFFKGAIDDVRIYTRALSPKEITALVTEGGYRPHTQAGLWLQLRQRLLRFQLGIGAR